MSFFIRVWRAVGSIHLTVVVCFLLTLDLAIGYLSLRANLGIFVPLGDVGLFSWLQTYGVHNWHATAWFFALLVLLTVLSLNTFVCTTDRLVHIVKSGRGRAGWRVKLAPHVMHYAVLLILAGYVCSYVLSSSLPGRALRPGESLDLPDGAGVVTFVDFAPEIYHGNRLEGFDGYVLAANAQLVLTSGGVRREAVLNFNSPVYWGGYGLFMNDFAPRKGRGGMKQTFIRMTIRRDPSSLVYLAGLALFVLGMGLYVFDRGMKR
ncbi:MAG: hypothetical protein JXQ84_00765 [Rhodospirillaceae bacterium]|nr:hypothetical protein [Rhodospirillaceae bacterium]